MTWPPYGSNNIGGEILGNNFFCNLVEVHLNMLAQKSEEYIKELFYYAGLECSALLSHEFDIEKFRYSREIDPIVGVSFTGLFDFFVIKFGKEWLDWWAEGRPHDERGQHFLNEEARYLSDWKEAARQGVTDYCDRIGTRVPSRYTTVQPAGTKSLLTGASPGWHPPKGPRFIRRITFAKDDPVAKACIDYGYSVVPAQKDTDEEGNLLNDPFDPRCTEWLVEIPVEVSWANLEGCDSVNTDQFPVKAQFDFFMQVQNHYTNHNCFTRSTEFLTDKGVKTFEDFEPGDYVKVLNGNGDWVYAPIVRTEDMRTMYRINLRQGTTGRTKSIVATGCHRFPVRRASGGNSKVKILTTLELQPGYRFLTNTAEMLSPSKEGIHHGLILGDGSRYRNKKGDYVGSQLYLCGGKRELVNYFLDSDRLFERDDIDQTRIYGLPIHMKELPSPDCSQEYLAGFVAGLLATDGNIHESVISFSTGSMDVVQFLTTQLPRLGILITSVGEYSSSGYENSSPTYEIRVSKETFPENLILRSFHQDHFDSRSSQPRQWRVVSVEELEEPEYGWCVMEPETNQFTLTENILVMNTSATLEYREHEIDEFAHLLYDNISNFDGYMSAAMMARFDSNQTFPRLPFEPISKERYEEEVAKMLERRKSDDFYFSLMQYDIKVEDFAGPSGCDGDKCLMPEKSPS